MNKLIYLISLSFLIIGCKAKQTTIIETDQSKENTELTVDEPRDTTSLLEIITQQPHSSQDTGDAYQVISAMIDNDVLWLEVSYGGGCKEHFFKMYYSNEIQEGKNGHHTATATLWHNGNNDVCRSIVSQKIRFNLEPIKSKDYKELEISIGGQKTIDYRY